METGGCTGKLHNLPLFRLNTLLSALSAKDKRRSSAMLILGGGLGLQRPSGDHAYVEHGLVRGRDLLELLALVFVGLFLPVTQH